MVKGGSSSHFGRVGLGCMCLGMRLHGYRRLEVGCDCFLNGDLGVDGNVCCGGLSAVGGWVKWVRSSLTVYLSFGSCQCYWVNCN